MIEKTSPPQLSVVVCTYNRAGLLKLALESLVQQQISPECLEVVVVDNNSSDLTHRMADSFSEQFCHWQLVTEVRQGLSHARNRGWWVSRGRFVAFLDDDAQAAPDWAGRIVQAFTRVQPVPASVGGKILPWYDRSPPCWFSDEFEIQSWGETARFLSGANAKYGFFGSNMAFPRETLERLKGFDAGYGMVANTVRLGEETELYMRLYKDSPLFWYDPLLTVYHIVSDENFRLGRRLQRRFRSGRTRAALEKRRFFTREYVAECQNLCRLLISYLCVLRPGASNRRVKIAEGLHKICSQLGYLFG